ncbi:hypothetical protein ACWDUL_21450 [Nocardia niigatensis]
MRTVEAVCQIEWWFHRAERKLLPPNAPEPGGEHGVRAMARLDVVDVVGDGLEHVDHLAGVAGVEACALEVAEFDFHRDGEARRHPSRYQSGAGSTDCDRPQSIWREIGLTASSIGIDCGESSSASVT